jgi:hypothetical protein
MPYPRLHRDFEDLLVAPPVYRLSDFAGPRDEYGHEAERAVERVQRCLDRLDELLEPLPFERVESEDTGPFAA